MSSRRTRGRGNPRGRQQNIRNQQMDSNGPGSRIRGTPQQILDRYLTLARDAYTAGETVLAENLFQHAEHYARMLNAAAPAQQPGQQNSRDDQSNDGYGDNDGDDAIMDSGNSNGSGNGYSDRSDRNRQPQAAGPSPADPPPVKVLPESPSDDQLPASDEQPSAPPRRRRRSRFQRQQDQDAADSNAQSNGAANDSTHGNGDANESAQEVIAPPIDLSAVASESAPAAPETNAEPSDRTLV